MSFVRNSLAAATALFATMFLLTACPGGGGLVLRGNYCKEEQTQKTDIPDEENQSYKKASFEVKDLPVGEYIFQSSEVFVEMADEKDESFKLMATETIVKDKSTPNLGCVRGDFKQSFDYSISGINKIVVAEGGKVLIDTKSYRLHTGGGPQDKIEFTVGEAQKSSAAKPSDAYESHNQVVFYQNKTNDKIYEIRSYQTQGEFKVMLAVQLKLEEISKESQQKIDKLNEEESGEEEVSTDEEETTDEDNTDS